MKRALPAVATMILISIGSPVLAQGFLEMAPGFGATGGAGAAMGKKVYPMAGALGNPAARQAANRAAANTYISAVRMQRLGKQAEAAALLASFAQQRQRLYGVRDQEVLKSYDSAAELATRAGKMVAAEQYMRRALAVCKNVSGVNSADAIKRMNKLGDALPGAETPVVAGSALKTENPAGKPENAVPNPDPTQTQTPSVPPGAPPEKP